MSSPPTRRRRQERFSFLKPEPLDVLRSLLETPLAGGVIGCAWCYRKKGLPHEHDCDLALVLKEHDVKVKMLRTPVPSGSRLRVRKAA